MSVKNVEKKEHGQVELLVSVGPEEFEAAVEQAYRKNKNKINVPGFRRGKAPRKVIEAMYGPQMFYEDAVELCYPQALQDAVKSENLRTVGHPSVEMENLTKEDGLTFKATYALYPEVKLGQYKGLSAVRPPVEVTDADLADALRPYIERASTIKTVERAVKDGDQVLIDYEGFKDGVPFEGGKAEKYTLDIGSGNFIPGFEEQLVGLSAGEDKELHLTFPEHYHAEELAGAPVVFQVKLHEVREKVEPELDDEFAKDVSEFETLEAFREDLKKKVAERKAESSKKVYEGALMQRVLDHMEAEIPEVMVELQLDKIIDDYARQIAGQGIAFDQYLKMMNMELSDLRKNLRETALGQVRTEVALSAVVDAEQMEIPAEEIEAEYKKIAEMYQIPEKRVRDVVAAEEIAQDLKLRNAAKLIVETGVETAPEETPEEKAEETAEEKPAKKPRKTKKTDAAGEDAPAQPKKAAKKEESVEEARAE